MDNLVGCSSHLPTLGQLQQKRDSRYQCWPCEDSKNELMALLQFLIEQLVLIVPLCRLYRGEMFGRTRRISYYYATENPWLWGEHEEDVRGKAVMQWLVFWAQHQLREKSVPVFTGNTAFSLNLVLHTPVEVLPLASMVLELKSFNFSHHTAADIGPHKNDFVYFPCLWDPYLLLGSVRITVLLMS